jgi:hypothetical protein
MMRSWLWSLDEVRAIFSTVGYAARMFKKAFQRDRSERQYEAYSRLVRRRI